MGPTRRLVTIKRSGVDGPHFPLSLHTCLFGRGIECDIRIQLPVVSKQHCKIEINEQEAILFNFSSTNPTQVNGSTFDKPVQLKHGDVITVVDRSFRYENESHQNGSKSPEFPGQRWEQEPLRRVSRSSFPSTLDGNVQDSSARSKFTEEAASGRPVVGGKNVTGAGIVSGGSEEPVAGKTPNSVHSSERPGGNGRNATAPTAGDSQEGSRVTFGISNGELKAFSSRKCLKGSDQNESPFKKLYESMKVELDVKSGKVNVLQNRRKSGSQSHCTTEKESTGGLQSETLVSPKSRPKSGQSPQIKADPASGERGSSQTEGKRSDEEAFQTPKETRSPSSLCTEIETLKTTTPTRDSQPSPSRSGRSEDLSVVNGGASLNLDQSEGSRADNKTFPPRKFLPRIQTPIKVESLGNTPEKLCPRKRKRIPTNVDDLTTETEILHQTISAPLFPQVERKIQSDFLNKPEKLGVAADPVCPGLPGLSSADGSSFDDSTNKMDGVSLKRRRVSFGGCLRPELFDENLPPNTPLKRGETPKQRRSLVTHTPTVLKKIIKEQPQPGGKEESSEVCLEATAQNAFVRPPAPNAAPASPDAPDRCRSSSKASSISSDGTSPHQTDIPKRGGRKSGNLPSKRASVDRSQHGILQMICSKRRSGASEANLVVAKSWADVVKLGTKQTQTKGVKRGPPRPLSKRQRRTSTPKKLTGIVHNQFSTGHANSPCTIIIGKAHVEKVNGPARPYRMLSNFVVNKPMDFSEDLSGLPEMFKTPVKEKPQRMSLCPSTFSNSEDLLGKELPVPHSGEKPLLCASENSGQNVSPRTQDAPEELSDQSSASPALRRRCINISERIMKTPRNVYKTTGAEMKTPASEARIPKTTSSANKCGRSVGLRRSQTPGVERKHQGPKPDALGNTLGRCLRKAPQPEQKLEGDVRESETWTEHMESKENSKKMVAVRRSRRASELQCELAADLTALESFQKTQAEEDQVDIPSLLQTPAHAKEAVDAENKATKTLCKSPRSGTVGTPTRTNTQLKTPSWKVDVEDASALGKLTQTPGKTMPVHREPGDDKSIKLFQETPKQKLDPAENVAGSKRRPRTPKGKAPPLEDLAGFKELFQTPDHANEPMIDEKKPKMLCQSPQPEPVNTPNRKGHLKTPSQKVDVQVDVSALRKPQQTPGETTHSHREPEGGDRGIAVSQERPEEKLDPAENVTGSKRRPRTPRKTAPPLEDLAGFKELFQTPDHAKQPMTDDKPTTVPYKSPPAEAVNMPTSSKRCLKTPSQKVAVQEDVSALRKPTHSHREPEVGDRGIAVSQEAPGEMLGPAENVIGSKRRPRTPKEKAPALEDLVGFKELFQTPNHTVEPMSADKSFKMLCQSPQLEPINTPSRKGHLNTPSQKVAVQEGVSALRKPTHSQREPKGGDRGIAVSQEAPEEKLDSSENVTRSKRQPRTPKEKAPPLEDLAGFKELFQTPHQAKEPMTEDRTPKMLCQSPPPEPVVTSTSMTRRLKTPSQKVAVQEDLSALRKPTHSHREPEGGDRGIAVSQETPEEKLDPAENVIGSKRRPRTPNEKAPALEDLVGFKELFQTPNHTVEPMSADKSFKMLCQSPQLEPINTPSRKGHLNTPSQKVAVQEGVSALRKPTHSQREPKGGDRGIAVSQEAPEEKLDSSENVTRSKRQPRTPKEKAPPLEDLAGFKELFQTPHQAKEPMTEDRTPKMLCQSPPPEPVVTSTSMTRRLKTPSQKVAVQEDLSALRKPTHSHREPEGGDRGIAVSQETPEEKLDPAENVTGSKRQLRTPKEKAPPLEDLAGFKELFQTPDHAEEQMTNEKTTTIPYKSPAVEPVTRQTGRKRRLRSPRGKVDVEEPSAPRKPTQTPGGARHSDRERVDDDKSIKLSKETLKQKLDSAENVNGSKRPPRTPKEKVQSLEDLAGFKELFQTPDHAKEPRAVVKTPKTLCMSSQPQLIVTPTNTKRWLKTPLGKADIETELSACRMTQSPGETRHSEGEPVDDDKSIKSFQETPHQKLNSSENVSGSKRRPRTPKKNVPPLEDLAGFKELFQTPDRAKEPTTGDRPTNIPCQSPQPEPVNTPNRKGRLKTPSQKVDVQVDVSALRKPQQTPGETTHSHREPEGGDRGIAVSQEAPGEKLDPAENVTGSKRRPRTPKEKAPPLEDLAGFKELFQTPDHAEEKMTNEKTTTRPYRSPAVEPVTRRTGRKRRLKSPPGKVDVEEPSAPRKPTQTPEDMQREPVCDEKDRKAFKENSRQKLVSAENVIGIKSRLRTLKGKAQPVEDSCSFNKLFQKPGRAKKPVSDVKIAPVPCQSPPAEPVTRPASRKRRLKSPPEKVGVEEPSAPRKPTQTPGDMQREPVCDEKDSKVIKETSRQKLNPAENVMGIKSRLRTFKEKTQPVEDSCSFKELFQKPDQAKEPVSDVKITAVPCQSPPAERVTRSASRQRRLKSPLGKVDLEELSVLREPIQTAGETMHRESVGDENNINVFKETSRQNLDSAENVICVKSRLRTFKEKAQPLEDPASFKELFQKPDQAKELGSIASGVKRAPKQTADRRPVEISRRVLRAPKVRFMGDLVGSRDPVKSPGESCISPSPKRKLEEDARVVGRKRLCPTMAAQDPEEEKPLQKKQRTAPRERREPPKPSGVKKRSLRILAQRTNPVGHPPTSDTKTEATDPQGEDAHAPNKGISLRTRHPTKTNIEEQRPGSLISAGKMKIKRSEKKSMKTSQEMKLQSPKDGAENPTSGGKVQERRRHLRSGKENQKPLPDAAEETARQERVEIPVKKQEEKEVMEYSDFKGLRSRKITLRPRGKPSESESEQRVTRGARRCANSLQKENDNVGVKKIRTRSHRDSEDK
ncbi:proliferation marker protein Ki-67 [Mesoplodon densirostris]|uniref:proliferation marker protein Ki-67 n=1 Tax=Mesoplodon densirostris TaxID=48708 RepID=UPI0028DD1251|nr:proliferation marker protein Ki-67 [Mesoplodon densirostris]XP_059954390.1 proliferation marker protein Ki-67 [Mesoplodon densirostris]